MDLITNVADFKLLSNQLERHGKITPTTTISG